MNSKYIRIVTVLLALGASGLGPAFAGDADSIGEGAAAAAAEEASSPPRAPLRVSKVDFQDTEDGSGKLTLAGIALPGSELQLFLDNAPLATVMPDDGGKWSFESAMALDDNRHTLRADQYDQATNMLAARAMITIQRAKPGAGDGAPEVPASKATSP